ncbi:maleylpyruvate isomerase family mycothiol-dependent enzyme [Thalassiella azotivora]
MTGVPLTDSRRWVRDGTELLLGVLDRVDDHDLDGATALPGWTGRHLVAHVAANAEALVRLATWARTGVETPMYDSPGQRDADIRTGATLPPSRLRAWVRESAKELDAAFDALDAAGGPGTGPGGGDSPWQAPVRTAQGRTVPATQVPWLRAREVMVHAVDLAVLDRTGGPGYADLPVGFLTALVADVATKRSAGPGPALVLAPDGATPTTAVQGDGEPVTVTGPLPALAAWLTGRSATSTLAVRTADGTDLPDLPRWL